MSGEGKVWAATDGASTQLIIEDELITGLYTNESQAEIAVVAGQCTQLLFKSADTYGGVYNTFTLLPEFSVTEGRAAVGDHLWGVWAAVGDTP
jgi:hypothetical protein